MGFHEHYCRSPRLGTCGVLDEDPQLATGRRSHAVHTNGTRLARRRPYYDAVHQLSVKVFDQVRPISQNITHTVDHQKYD